VKRGAPLLRQYVIGGGGSFVALRPFHFIVSTETENSRMTLSGVLSLKLLQNPPHRSIPIVLFLNFYFNLKTLDISSHRILHSVLAKKNNYFYTWIFPGKHTESIAVTEAAI
jgi:hypothetical protein